MSTPLSATHRLVFNYRVGSLDHVAHHYCGLVASGDPSGYDVQRRPPFVTLGVSDAVDRLWTLLAPLYNAANTAFGQVELQELSGTAWLPLGFYQTAVTASSAVAYWPCSQLTMVLRDLAFHKIKAVWLESILTPPSKTNVVTGFGTLFQALAEGYTTPGASNDNPFMWVRGRSDLNINTFVSMVGALNNRLRRERSLV